MALFFFLIILPFGSFLYLTSGTSFYREHMAQLEIKGQSPDFKLTSHKGKVMTQDSLLGRVHVVSYLNQTAAQPSQFLTRQLKRVQEQFKNRNDVGILTYTSEEFSADQTNWIIKQRAINNFWHFLNDSPENTKTRLTEGYKFPKIENNYSPNFVLMDDSLKVRGYYDGMDSMDVNKMIVHITLIMPRAPKEEIVFKREQEK